MVSDLLEFGVVYYNPSSIASISSLDEVVKSRRVVLDSEDCNKFRIFKGEHKIIFFSQSL